MARVTHLFRAPKKTRADATVTVRSSSGEFRTNGLRAMDLDAGTIREAVTTGLDLNGMVRAEKVTVE
jgi:hypothetical protein